jgi:hypothetical protein
VDKPNGEYEVGYAKPPKSGQFAQGRSGNPHGRSKGSKNLANVVLRESRQLVRVNGPSGSRKVTKLEAAVMQLGNKSVQGDLRAQREFFGLVQRAEEDAYSNAAPLSFHEMDKQVIENIHRRMQSIRTHSEEPPTETPE